MIVISFVFVVKISCVQTQNIMGNETSQEENCEQLNWTLENGILIIYGQGKIPMDFFEDNSIDPEITENKGFDDDDEEPKIIINK